jgi:uncharacterized protein YecT (DUF1311 family)
MRHGWTAWRSALIFGAVALTLAHCAPRTPRLVPSEAGLSAAPGESAASPASASLAEGTNDLRGTLGASTSIAMRLVRSGSTVAGSYVYLAIGRPIALQGSADANGTVALTETAGGKATGAFRLRPEGDGLTGDWTDPSGKKTFPVRLAAGGECDAGPANASDGDATAGDAGAASGPSKQAEDCLAQPICSAADAARLFVRASDARDPDLDCFRFLDGAGVPRDLVRARACLERRAPALDCGGSSMSLETAELSLMRIDAIGGRSDVAGGRALVDGCFDDVTREAILEHAAARERDPKTPPTDFCKDIGGTTITAEECEGRNGTNTETARDLEAKAVVASLDGEGRNLFARSDKAFRDYVSAVGDYVYEVYIDGTIRGSMSLAAQSKLEAERVTDLAAFRQFVAKDTTPQDVEAASRARAVAFHHLNPGTAAEKAALAKTQQTWEAYRDAELALYEHAFGPTQGMRRVEAALRVRLESRRAAQCGEK